MIWPKHDMKAARTTLAPDFVMVEPAGIESADQEAGLLAIHSRSICRVRMRNTTTAVQLAS